MEGILKADIFFFVTTILTILISLVIICILIYVLLIVKNIKTLSDKVKTEGGKIVDDVEKVRQNVKEKAATCSHIAEVATDIGAAVSAFKKHHDRKPRSPRKKSEKPDTSSESK